MAVTSESSFDMDALRPFITETAPFGPSKTEDLLGGGLPVFQALYDTSNDTHRKMGGVQPNCLVGRKGSGKTALLIGLATTSNAHPIILDQVNIFSSINILIKMADDNGTSLLVEHVGDIWLTAVAHAVAVETILSSTDSEDIEAVQTVWRYLRGFTSLHELDQLRKGQSDRIVSSVIGHFRWTIANARYLTPSELIDSLEYDGIPYREMFAALRKLLLGRPTTVYVVIDSLDEMTQALDKVSEATRGLLHLLNSDQRARFGFNLFVGLPSEAMDVLSMLSANPAKNMERSLHIKWTAHDLIALAAHRFGLYLELYEPAVAAVLPGEARARRAAVRAIIMGRLPRKVENLQGHQEDTLAYIVRHTHLLPRQFIQYLNAIWSEGISAGGQRASALDANAVRSGVAKAEATLVSDVLTGYMAHHGQANDVCRRVIPMASNRMLAKEMLEIIRQTGTDTYTGGDARDVLQMLADIGAVGRFEQETGVYAEARFNFHVPGRLTVHEDEEVCVHPMYSSTFESLPNRRRTLTEQKAVYPYGIDLAELLT